MVRCVGGAGVSSVGAATTQAVRVTARASGTANAVAARFSTRGQSFGDDLPVSRCHCRGFGTGAGGGCIPLEMHSISGCGAWMGLCAHIFVFFFFFLCTYITQSRF